LPSVSETAVEAPTAIKIEDVAVTYRASYEAKPTLRSALLRMGRGEKIVREIQALDGVTFDVPQGGVTGVIGVNGAGKSTLMRCIAGILPPSTGRIEVHGRVSTLLALGVGFNNKLSGRENVILGGLAAGLKRDQLHAKYEDIAAFAELGDFMDLPMRTYSSGMYGRLAFSVAVNMDPDILLIDEALSVGDARFKRKSFEKMRELCERAGTIVLVSHALRSVRELCSQVVWMDKGRVMMHGDTDEVLDAYERYMEVGDSEVAREDV
jgi:ABC-type polysaccharide/polyol phosphate transport system ATPase subunit